MIGTLFSYPRRFSRGEWIRTTNPPTPEPQDNEVLVEVVATSVNPIDRRLRSGELQEYDGRDARGPILLAADGDVFNVALSRNFYGPDGEYAAMAGTDATRMLARNSLEQEAVEAGPYQQLYDQWLRLYREALSRANVLPTPPAN